MGHSKFVILIILVVLGLSSLLALRQLQPTALAQSEPAAAGRVHLPLVWGKGAGDPNPPTPTATSTPLPTPAPQWATQTKSRSGIHLGNRNTDWQDGSNQYRFLERVGRTLNGYWPAAVVVQSNQLYDLQRFDSLCRVSGASVKTVNGREYELFLT